MTYRKPVTKTTNTRSLGRTPKKTPPNGKQYEMQEWDLLKEEIAGLEIDNKYKVAVLNLLQTKFAGQRIYIRAGDARDETRRKAVKALIAANVPPVDAAIAISNRFGVSRETARKIVKNAIPS